MARTWAQCARCGGGLRARPRLLWGGIAGLVALIALAGSYYQVEPDEVGMVTRFGRFVRSTGPGPHGKVPFGIERVQKVPVERQLKQEFGFRTRRRRHREPLSQGRKDGSPNR